MKTLLSKILHSKKFWYAIAGVLSIIITANTDIDGETLIVLIVGIAGIVVALITGQGLSDLGKEKAKIENEENSN